MGVPLRVLLLEDSPDDAELMLGALRSGGFEPEALRVDAPAQFERALERGNWQVILADHHMPSFSSLDALAMIVERGLDIPFLLVSGTLGEEAEIAAMRAGAHDYILKSHLTRLPAAVGRELREFDDRARRREAEERQAEAEERYRELVEQIPAATYRIVVAGGELQSVFVSPQIETFTGYTPAEWRGKAALWQETLHPDDREGVLSALAQSAARAEPFVAEYRVLRRDGSTVWLRNEGRWALDPDGERRALHGFIADVTDRRRAQEVVARFAYQDPLTGLPNGAWLREKLEAEIGEARGATRSLALLRLCVGRIREINSTLGRLNGDRILKRVADTLSELREHHSVARLGAGEFAVLAAGIDAESGRRFGERLISALQEPIVLDGLPVEIDTCIGIGVYPGHGEDADTLMRHADTALDCARQDFSGCVVYSRQGDPYDPRRLALMGELRRAIEGGDQLRLEYQPKISLESRKVVGVEALLRWNHPEHGNIPPAEFVGLAENSALIRPLTWWVLNEAARQCRRWQQAGIEVTVAVNLSARSLLDKDLVDRLASLLETWALRPQALSLEITESAIMADPSRAIAMVDRLSALGIAISIDDFGTGYSSLAYLRRLRVAEVKIDRSFVVGLSTHQGDLAIVRAVIDLVHRLGLRVVAEGVEDAKAWGLLEEAGCDMAQGYHMARPMAAADFEGWLGRSDYGLASLAKEERIRA